MSKTIIPGAPLALASVTTATTAVPPPEDCCERCSRIIVSASPCRCDPQGRALELLDKLLGTILEMNQTERVEFIAISGDRMQRVFRGERDSVIG